MHSLGCYLDGVVLVECDSELHLRNLKRVRHIDRAFLSCVLLRESYFFGFGV